MIKAILIALALTFTSCGGQIMLLDCDPFEAGGLTICSLEPVDPDEVEELVSVVEQETIIHYPEVIGLKNMLRAHGVMATFLNVGGLAEGCHETGYDGLYECTKVIGGQNRGGSEIIVQYRSCLAITSLAHEILHSIQFFDLHSSDSDLMNHDTPWLFSTWGEAHGHALNTVEDRVLIRLYPLLKSCHP